MAVVGGALKVRCAVLRQCRRHDACNWLLAADAPGTLCAAQASTIAPSPRHIAISENLVRWQRLELAKHRLFYSLLRLRLPLQTRIEDPEHGLAFDFLANSPDPTGPKVLTGHDNGLHHDRPGGGR